MLLMYHPSHFLVATFDFTTIFNLMVLHGVAPFHNACYFDAINLVSQFLKVRDDCLICELALYVT